VPDRLDLKRGLNELAFRQAGYFSAAQARELGFSYQAQKYHADRGNWVRVDRGMFRVAGWPTDLDDGYVRATVWSGGTGVISHESAAAVHDLGDFDPGQVHLTLAEGRSAPSGLVLHRAELASTDVVDRAGYRVTAVTRTLLDLAASEVPQEQLTTAVDEALRAEAIGIGSLRRRIDDFGAMAALRMERALADRSAPG
jgi:predicted transcriptional regulator of viral defense system